MMSDGGCIVLNAFDLPGSIHNGLSLPQGGRLTSTMSPTIDNSRFRRITPGIETLRCNFSLPRHRHLRAYATVVLAGSFEESGYNGRIQATVGDVLIHPALDCHGNQTVSAGVKLIRLHWPDASGIGGLYHLEEVDELGRVAETDVIEATHLLERALREKCLPAPGKKNDWPDLLLADLAKRTSTEIGIWAEVNGLARETVSRGFAAAYGIAPSVLRAELRARSAWLRITRSSERLCRIALEAGFADQAHMTRWIHRITGVPPAVWRRNASILHVASGSLREKRATVCWGSLYSQLGNDTR
jgi:AraC-like DNA-binding protein